MGVAIFVTLSDGADEVLHSSWMGSMFRKRAISRIHKLHGSMASEIL